MIASFNCKVQAMKVAFSPLILPMVSDEPPITRIFIMSDAKLARATIANESRRSPLESSLNEG
jgi:hypothetical protein